MELSGSVGLYGDVSWPVPVGDWARGMGVVGCCFARRSKVKEVMKICTVCLTTAMSSSYHKCLTCIVHVDNTVYPKRIKSF